VWRLLSFSATVITRINLFWLPAEG